jgi:hypothetical protein
MCFKLIRTFGEKTLLHGKELENQICNFIINSTTMSENMKFRS